MPGVEDIRLTELGNKSWKQEYEGIEATDEKLQELNRNFADYVQRVYQFNDARRDDLEEYLEQLGKIEDHWEEINRWIKENAVSMTPYSTSLSNIRDIFGDIANLTGGIRRQIIDNANIVRRVNGLAADAVYLATKEEGLSAKAVKDHAQKAEKYEYLYKLRLKAAGLALDESKPLKEQLAVIDAFNQRHDQLLGSLEAEAQNYRDNYGDLDAGQRRYLRNLEERIAAEKQLVDMTTVDAIKGVSRLKEQLDLRNQILKSQISLTKFLPEQIAGELPEDAVKNGRLINQAPTFSVGLTSRFLKKFGLGETAEDLEKQLQQYVSTRTVAVEGYLTQKQDIVPDLNEQKGRVSTLQQRISSEEARKTELTGQIAELVRQRKELEAQGGRDSLGKFTEQGPQVVAREKQIASLVEQENNLKQAHEAVNKMLKKHTEEYGTAAANVRRLSDELAVADESLMSILKKGFDFKEILHTVSSGAIKKITGGLAGWPGIITAAVTVVGFIWRQLVKVSSEADKLKQHVGTWNISAAAANDSFASSVQWLQAGVELAERFKINPVQLFSPNEIGNMAEVKNLLGLSSDQAANLTVRTKMAGTNADQYRVALTKGVNAGNAAFKTAIGLGTATRGALNASDAITLSMGNNAEKIGKAAVAAASMGMELKDVEDISRNLMNFQSSIEAEMQAQLLTGKQLNLSKARELALNNDLEGVARELTNQGVSAADWGKMNYIQQENLARALGMSRDQMAKMLVTQYLSGQLSKQALMDATHMTAEQIEALGVQERMKIAVQKLAQAFVPILEILVPIVELISNITTSVAGLIGKLTGLSFKANQAGVKNKDQRYTNWSSDIGSSRFKGKLTPERAARKLSRELKQKDLSKEQKEQIQDQLAAIEKVKKSGGDRLIQEQEVAKILGVQTASMGNLEKKSSNLGTILTAVIGGLFMLPKAINGAAVGMGKLFQGAVQWKNSVVSIFKGGLKEKFLEAKDSAKAAAGSGATGAAGKAAQTVKGRGDNLPKLGSAIRRFLQNFDERVTAGMIGKATLAAAAFLPIALMSPAIALASVVGPLAAKGLPALGRGIAGFFKALSKTGGAVLGALPALLTVTGVVLGLAFALRLAAPAFEAFAKIITALGPALKSAFEGIASVVVSVGTAIKSACEGIATVIVAAFGGITNLLREITLEKAVALAAVGGGFASLATGVGAAALAVALFPASKLANILALTAKKPREEEQALETQESTRENKGISQENITEAVQEVTVKQAEAQANSQQISIEQKAADLSRIEKKMDELAKVIVSSRPDWNWLEFGTEMRRNTPWIG